MSAVHRPSRRADRIRSASARLYRDTLAVADEVEAAPVRTVRQARTARRQTRTILRTATLTGVTR